MSEPVEWESVMPFVVVASVGGPFDDAAYVCGWEMGALAARLEAAKHHGLGLPEAIIHRENVPQADLLAMKIGARMTEGWPGDHGLDNATADEWARVVFAWAVGTGEPT